MPGETKEDKLLLVGVMSYRLHTDKRTISDDITLMAVLQQTGTPIIDIGPTQWTGFPLKRHSLLLVLDATACVSDAKRSAKLR